MALIGLLPIIGVASIGYINMPEPPQQKEPAPIQLIYSQEAASRFGYNKANLKDGGQIKYTMMAPQESDTSQYGWQDKEVVYLGLESDIISVKAINKD